MKGHPVVKEQGVIEKVLGRKVVVRVQKGSACEHCKSRDMCNIQEREMQVEVINNLQAKAGDLVELSMPEGTVIKLSLIVYILPIIALMIGAFAGGALAAPLRMNQSLAAVIGGGILMIASYYVLKKFDRAAESNDGFHPRMTRILVSAASPPPGDSR